MVLPWPEGGKGAFEYRANFPFKFKITVKHDAKAFNDNATENTDHKVLHV